MVVAGDEDTLALTHMYFLFSVVKNHFAGIYIIQGILPRAVYAAAQVIIEKAVKNVVVIKYQLHRAKILFRIYRHSRFGFDCKVNNKFREGNFLKAQFSYRKSSISYVLVGRSKSSRR